MLANITLDPKKSAQTCYLINYCGKILLSRFSRFLIILSDFFDGGKKHAKHSNFAAKFHNKANFYFLARPVGGMTISGGKFEIFLIFPAFGTRKEMPIFEIYTLRLNNHRIS